MTLQQKLNDSIIRNINIVESENRMCYDYNHLELAENCEVIADEFAIGFAEWSIQWRVEFVDDTQEGVLYTYGGLYQKFTMKQLLEIYKKEKGL
jgi:hypothetical protein